MQFFECALNKFDPPVRATWQGVKDLRVKDEDAPDVLASLQGLGQREVIVDAQVASEPD